MHNQTRYSRINFHFLHNLVSLENNTVFFICIICTQLIANSTLYSQLICKWPILSSLVHYVVSWHGSICIHHQGHLLAFFSFWKLQSFVSENVCWYFFPSIFIFSFQNLLFISLPSKLALYFLYILFVYSTFSSNTSNISFLLSYS